MVEDGTRVARGRLIASVLAGAWRQSPPPLDVSNEDFEEVAPQLLESMGGALAWWKIRRSDLKTSTIGSEFQEAYRSHSIRTLVRQHIIKRVLTILDAEGVESILVKGWAVARLYPEQGLRPYGDIDLVVRSQQYAATLAATRGVGGEYHIDVHDGFGDLDGCGFDYLYERSTMARLDDVDVRILSPEDQLRLLCRHLLHHGAFRPLWLCDIAAAVECRSVDFDWDRCLSTDVRHSDWVECAIGLAHQLLGAIVGDTPCARRARSLPRWLISSVLKQWGTPYSMSQVPKVHHAPMAKYIRHPRGLLSDLRRRWPNPIEATVYVGGSFNEFPRLPFQIGECIGRTAKFIARLPKAFRDQ